MTVNDRPRLDYLTGLQATQESIRNARAVQQAVNKDAMPDTYDAPAAGEDMRVDSPTTITVNHAPPVQPAPSAASGTLGKLAIGAGLLAAGAGLTQLPKLLAPAVAAATAPAPTSAPAPVTPTTTPKAAEVPAPPPGTSYELDFADPSKFKTK